jgi:hypothetical protein
VLVNSKPEVSWDAVAAGMGDRSARQCRERYINYLDPSIRVAPWTDAEDLLLLEKINVLGHCWAKIGRFFCGRTENDVKNRWYSHLKFRSMFDPMCGGYRLIEPEMLGHPPRRTRRRVCVSPKIAAEKAMREKAETQIPAVHGEVETDASPAAPEWADSMDKILCWELANEEIETFSRAFLM